MKHIDIFTGIGGFALAAKWAGWETIAWCEIDKFCQTILKYHFPNAIGHGDIRSTDFTIYRGQCNILTGGFPCQDASNANQSKTGKTGLSGERTGLFWQMCRAIDEIRPEFVVAENVSNILKVNGGGDFTTILTELSRMGYNAEWRVCSSSEVGAPHKRPRLYLVAYSNSIRMQGNQSLFSLLRKKTPTKRGKITGTNVEVNADNEWLGESPVYCLDDGVPERLDIITQSIKAFGNSISPQIPFQIFKAINKIYYANRSPYTLTSL